jgi:hypothetical protein
MRLEMTRKPNIIHVVVRDSKGRPVSGARVYFIAGPGPLPDIAALTGADGKFALAAPASGKYEVGCTTDQASTSRSVDVTGKDVTVELRLP